MNRKPPDPDHRRHNLGESAAARVLVGLLWAATAAHGQGVGDQSQAPLSGAQLQSIRGTAAEVLTAKRAERGAISASIEPVREALHALRTSLIDLAAPVSSLSLPTASASTAPSPQPSAAVQAVPTSGGPVDVWSQRQRTQIERVKQDAARLEALLQPPITPSSATRTAPAPSPTATAAPAAPAASVVIQTPAVNRLRGIPAEIDAALSLPASERHQQLQELADELVLRPPSRRPAVTEARAPAPSLSSRTRHRVPQQTAQPD